MKQGNITNKVKFDTIDACKQIKFTKNEKDKRKIMQTVATENLGLVTHTIQKYFKQMATHLRKKGRYDELVSEGTLGLMRAIEMFDPERNIQFSTYAVPWIRQSVRKYLNGRALNIPAGDAAANLVWRYRKVHGNKPVHEMKLEEILENEFIKKNLSEKTIKQYLDQLSFRVRELDGVFYKKILLMDENKTSISNEELDVKNSISKVWGNMNLSQREKLMKFCEVADKDADGINEFEQIATVLCKANGIHKKPKDLINKSFCDALVETIQKIEHNIV